MFFFLLLIPFHSPFFSCSIRLRHPIPHWDDEGSFEPIRFIQVPTYFFFLPLHIDACYWSNFCWESVTIRGCCFYFFFFFLAMNLTVNQRTPFYLSHLRFGQLVYECFYVSSCVCCWIRSHHHRPLASCLKPEIQLKIQQWICESCLNVSASSYIIA